MCGSSFLQVGASKVYVEDLREDFLHNYIFPSIQANGEAGALLAGVIASARNISWASSPLHQQHPRTSRCLQIPYASSSVVLFNVSQSCFPAALRRGLQAFTRTCT